MKVSRPTIAVTGPDRGGFVAWWFTRSAIRAAGGRPVRMRPRKPRNDLQFDGLVIGGGADVGPQAYGKEPVSKPDVELLSAVLGRLRAVAGFVLAPVIFVLRWLFRRKVPMGMDAARDSMELTLLDHAARCDLPVLGICRGAQLINVHAGGTLHRSLVDLYEEAQTLWTVLPRKRVGLEPESILAATLKTPSCWVNSLHRQAVANLGEDLRITARDEGGIVQAVEHTKRRFWIGVQWHPEYMPQQEEQRRIFKALILEAARMQQHRTKANLGDTTSRSSP